MRALFDSLKELLPDEPGSPSQAEIAARLGMTENAIRQAFYRFRQRYQSLLREEIAHTVATPGDIEDELRHLIAVLRGVKTRIAHKARHELHELPRDTDYTNYHEGLRQSVQSIRVRIREIRVSIIRVVATPVIRV